MLLRFLLINSPESTAEEIAKQENLIQTSDEGSIKEIVRGVLNNFPAEVERFKSGETKLLGMFMGQVMKASQGKVDPKMANQLIQECINE